MFGTAFIHFGNFVKNLPNKNRLMQIRRITFLAAILFESNMRIKYLNRGPNWASHNELILSELWWIWKLFITFLLWPKNELGHQKRRTCTIKRDVVTRTLSPVSHKGLKILRIWNISLTITYVFMMTQENAGAEQNFVFSLYIVLCDVCVHLHDLDKGSLRIIQHVSGKLL